MSIFCKHEWKLISETTTRAAIEVLGSVGMPFHIDKGGPHFTERKHIQLVQCDKCGKLKRFVEKLN